MGKVVTWMMWIFLIFSQGSAMAKGDLIAEVLSFAKPERFHSLDVSTVVLRYVPLGVEKKTAMRELREQGFEVEEITKKLDGCAGCEPRIVLGGYTKSATIPFLPYESFISVGLGFKKGKVAFVSAWHTKNAY
ncbi:hypothetical protein [Chromobacterium sp. IIBBL 290-4]|uniref:hypothetical protein n=1 Tax=Chromobacterium sp. IIBBL 290-4 TaxID=2953890 RepID=UPI0020B66FDD|nr:hypothetical protein [Chromobacterium sp. IIBBL 290-4]UTH76200.1 hypothetical protein NKT35_08900 [Chromobacterium sp. IIBBL 290-4]